MKLEKYRKNIKNINVPKQMEHKKIKIDNTIRDNSF